MATKDARKLKVYAALPNDVSNGHVWLKDSTLERARCIVKITNPENQKSVYCEALQFDDNFVRLYNDGKLRHKIDDQDASIVMSYWYRWWLGDLKTRNLYPLKIERVKLLWWGQFWACWHHPQVIVRVALVLGTISVILGATSLLVGLIMMPICRALGWSN